MTKDHIEKAWDAAQVAFRAMLDAGVYQYEDHPLTRAYVSAERYLDLLLDAARAEVEAQRLKR
jgi:hypothetical protein